VTSLLGRCIAASGRLRLDANVLCWDAHLLLDGTARFGLARKPEQRAHDNDEGNASKDRIEPDRRWTAPT
jgi:hypothetical protein